MKKIKHHFFTPMIPIGVFILCYNNKKTKVIMSFLENHPNYKTYKSEKFFVNDVPDDIEEALQGLLVKLADGEGNRLKYLINKIGTVVNSGMTQNWGWSYLIEDLNNSIRKLITSNYNKFFDFLEILYDNDVASIDEINNFLEENYIGYVFSNESSSYTWILREDCEIAAIQRTETLLQTPTNLCQQARDHLQQIINNLNTGTERANKDALRDGLSALETLMKQVTQTNDIKDAAKKLRSLNIAPDFLIKEGLSIWDRMHQEYPDVRHGNPNLVSIGKAELLYCLNKILIYIEFLCDLNIK